MTSPSYINKLFVSSWLIWHLGFVCSKLQSVAVMTSSRKYSICWRMRLNKELTASDQSSSSDDDDSSGTDDLSVGKVIFSE